MSNRRFRFWQKKRGDRRTGSRWAATVGEALLCALILLLGFFVLTAFVAARFFPLPFLSPIASGGQFWLAAIILVLMIGGSGLALALTILNAGTSVERRQMLARKVLSPPSGDEVSTASRETPEFPWVPSWFELADSPGTVLRYRLPATIAPTYRILGQAAFCLLWLAALAMLGVWVFESMAAKQPRWLLAIAALVVAGLAARYIYSFLVNLVALIRVGPSCLEVSQIPLFPGGVSEIAVSQLGRLRCNTLRLMLVCDERVTYREGTNHRVETRRIFEHAIPLPEVASQTESASWARVILTLPEDVMHSFESASNAIRWSFQLEGEFSSGRQFCHSFPVVVAPRQPVTGQGR